MICFQFLSESLRNEDGNVKQNNSKKNLALQTTTTTTTLLVLYITYSLKTKVSKIRDGEHTPLRK